MVGAVVRGAPALCAFGSFLGAPGAGNSAGSLGLLHGLTKGVVW